jgi:hypothetical protein
MSSHSRMFTAGVFVGALSITLLMVMSSKAMASETDFYLAGGLQRTNYNLPDDGIWYQNLMTYDASLRKTGSSVGAGYHAHKYLDIELNHRRLGKGEIRHAFNVEDSVYETCKANGHCPMATGADRTSWSVRGESIDVLPTLPITDDLSVYGRLGFFKYRVTSHTEAWQLGFEQEPCWTETIHGKGTSNLWGVGAFYRVDKKHSLGAEYINFPDLTVPNTASKSAYQVGFVYRYEM